MFISTPEGQQYQLVAAPRSPVDDFIQYTLPSAVIELVKKKVKYTDQFDIVWISAVSKDFVTVIVRATQFNRFYRVTVTVPADFVWTIGAFGTFEEVEVL